MNTTNIAVLISIGAILVAGGLFLRFIKFNYSSLFLIVGMTFNGVAIVMLIAKMFTDKYKQ